MDVIEAYEAINALVPVTRYNLEPNTGTFACFTKKLVLRLSIKVN